MKDDRLLDDDDLKAAFRSVRDAYDGTHPEANSTLHRALFRTRTRERRHRFTRWVVVPIAAVLAASTAWAGVTGKLTPAVQSVLESFHAELTNRFRLSEQLEITPRLNLTLQEPYRDSDQNSPFFYDKQVRRLRGRVVARWAPLDMLQLTGGADVAFDHGVLQGPADVGLQTAFGEGLDQVSYQNVAGFIEAFSDNPIVTVVAGARYDRHSAFGDSFVPRLVLLRSFGPFSGKALFSRAFRAPGVENISLGDNVRPERTTVFELEGSLRLGEGHTVSANAFDMGVTDPIIYSYDAEWNTEAYRNMGRLGSRGLELDYHLRGRWGRVALWVIAIVAVVVGLWLVF